MNKLHNFRNGFMMLYWTFQQWRALVLPREGETHEDCDMEDLRWWFFEYLNNLGGVNDF